MAIKFNKELLARLALDSSGYLFNKELMKKNIKTFAINRTLTGRDGKEREFKPYSKSYKDLRIKKGLPTRPNLVVTGELLNSMEIIDSPLGELKVSPVMKDGKVYSTYRFAVTFNDNPRKDANGRAIMTNNDGILTNNVLAKYLIHGTGDRPKPRNFLYISQRDLDDILGVTLRNVELPLQTLPTAKNNLF